jgi:hypothetical protein
LTKLSEEIDSWGTFLNALRTPDRILMRQLFRDVERDDFQAIEASPDEDITEAFFLAMLISQKKKIELIAEMKRKHEAHQLSLLGIVS